MKQVSKDYFINEYNSISSFCHENNEPVCVEKELIVIPRNYFENRDANLKFSNNKENSNNLNLNNRYQNNLNKTLNENIFTKNLIFLKK